MKELFINFYNDVAQKKCFWLPILIFCILGYSFSLLNPTISVDDLCRDDYIGDGNLMLTGRWGMVLWAKIMGVIQFSPFIDRYIALLFLICAAILLCVVFYILSKKNSVLPYTVMASAVVTYPLIHEIWEYTVANFVTTGNMTLVTLAAIVLLQSNTFIVKWKRILIAGLLLLLPMSSYESGIFYYVTLVSVIFFYMVTFNGKRYGFKTFLVEVSPFILPVFIALILRIIITCIILKTYALEYHSQGDTEILWFSHSLPEIAKNLLKGVGQPFALGLVYFPLTIFCGAVFVLFFYSLYCSVKNKSWQPMLFCLGVIFSVYVLVFIKAQGTFMGRTAIPMHIVVAFSLYYLCRLAAGRKIYGVTVVLSLLLCWHQGVYLNSLLAYNHIRSENELAALRQIGLELAKRNDGKPIFIVSPYDHDASFLERFRPTEKTWNQRLYIALKKKFSAIPQLATSSFVGTNFNNVSYQVNNLKAVFSYLGFSHLNICAYTTPQNIAILKEAQQRTINQQMKHYSINDVGDYVIVVLGSKLYPLHDDGRMQAVQGR